jgi:hypothetical protein
MVTNHQTERQTSVWKELFKQENFQISKYSNLLVEDIGVEPMTPCVQGRCSDQLS